MAIERTCRECGMELPAKAPQLLCPRCLVGMGLSLLSQEKNPTSASAAATEFFRITEKPGDQLGRYRLVERLGEGGGGSVYVADQEAPVRRQVALKIIKLGMDTRRVIARFEVERQTLAMMDHPHIAKVYDAGATNTGRPFFVMELVRGMHLTRYCDHHGLSTPQRLGLFIQVCRAIHHAHQKGIIHRDIKPSNILVTRIEEEKIGLPKVIDFGIAKATETSAQGDSVTGSSQPLGTPAYMSPEQVAGTDLDTRSDIYALGVLLYELLSGRLPFDSDRARPDGIEEWRRRIREEEPLRPSTRLLSLPAADRALIARHRVTEPARLTGLLRGDLDWIVMKALEKDRGRRYESAAALADDIQRHLEHEPVTACPPSTWYLVGKLARRHRPAFLAAGGVAAALVAGVAVSTILAIRARRAEQAQRVLLEQAKSAQAGEIRQRWKSDQVAHFLQEMLKGVGPSVALGRDTQLLREILDKTVAQLPLELKNQPDVEADLRHTIGDVYKALGLMDQAEVMQRDALRLRRLVYGPEHQEVAHSLNALAVVLMIQGKKDEAEPICREALRMYRRFYGPDDSKIVAALNNLGSVLNDRDPAAAEHTLREALALSRQVQRTNDPGSPNVLYSLAVLLKDRGQLDEAELLLIEALAKRRQLLNGKHPDIANTLNVLGNLQRERGRLDAAETNLTEALTMQREVLQKDHPAIATTLGNLSLLLERRGQHERAEAMCRESLEIYRKVFGNEHLQVATSLNNLALILGSRSDLAGAARIYREALELHQKCLGPDHPKLVVLMNNLGSVLRKQGQLEEAHSFHAQALALAEKVLKPTHPDVGFSWGYLGAVLRSENDYAGAVKAFAAAFPFMEKLYGRDHLGTAQAAREWADALLASGDVHAAAPLFRRMLAIYRQRLPANSTRLENHVYECAEVLFHDGSYADAESLYREVLRKRQERLPPDDELVAGAVVGLSRLLSEWAWTERPNFDWKTAANKTASVAVPSAVTRAREAVLLLRECLAARQRTLPSGSRRLYETKSRLGGALISMAMTDPELDLPARVAWLSEAEPLVLERAPGSDQTRTAAERRLHREALVRVVRLYESWDAAAPNTGKAAQALRWRQVLQEHDQPTTEQKK